MSDGSAQSACPLCAGQACDLYHQDRRRDYLQCQRCALVFVPPAFYLSSAEEKAEYDLHDNQVDDQGYRGFLNRLWSPLSDHLTAASRILEFGCGPGPALAKMMEEEGMQVSLYDHFYFPDAQVLKPSYYHAVTATEVIEHLHTPQRVFEKWIDILIPEGWLGIMTKQVKDRQAFSQWHYKNDLTHVCFFSHETFQWLALQYGLSVEFYGNDVVLMQKQSE